MRAKDFIYRNLRELVNKFPQIVFRYQFDESEQTHIVEVTPLEAYHKNQDYKNAEGDLTYEFDRAFPPESIMFVSEDSLTGITKAEKVFQKEDHIVWEISQDVVSGNELIPGFDLQQNDIRDSFDVEELPQEEFHYSSDLQGTSIDSFAPLLSQNKNTYALAA